MRDRRVPALIGVALLMGAGVFLSLRRAREPKPALYRAGMPPPAAARAPENLDRLANDPELPPPGLTFGEFVDLLGGVAKNPDVAPAAREVERSFIAEEELRALYEEYRKKKRDEIGSAAEFYREAREKPGFAKLMGRLATLPGLDAAARAVASLPFIGTFVNNQHAALKEAKGVGRFDGVGDVDADAVAREWAKKLEDKADETPSGPAVAVNLGGGAPSVRNPAAEYRPESGKKVTVRGQGLGDAGPLAAAGTRAASAGPSGALAGSRTTAAAGRSDDGALTRLGTIERAESESMDRVIREWLAKFGLNADVYLSDRTSGIWDLCFKRGELKKCTDACGSQPQQVTTAAHAVCAPPSDRTYWETCMESLGGISDANRDACLAACRQQSPCVVDPGWYDYRCVQPLMKTPKQAPHPNCGGGGTTASGKTWAGEQAYQCKQNGLNGGAWATDGRCYSKAAGKPNCCVSQAEWGDYCAPVGTWKKPACTCNESAPTAPGAASTNPFPCGGNLDIPPICRSYSKFPGLDASQCSAKSSVAARLDCRIRGGNCVCLDSNCSPVPSSMTFP